MTDFEFRDIYAPLFSLPTIIIIVAVITTRSPSQSGWSDLVGVVYLLIGIVSAVLAGLFLALNRRVLHFRLNWWRSLLCSAAALVLALSLVVLYARLQG